MEQFLGLGANVKTWGITLNKIRIHLKKNFQIYV